MNKTTDLAKFSTKELMNEISKRKNIIIVGNWYFKEHIIEVMQYLNIEPTDNKIKTVFEEKNLGLDSAKDDLENFILENCDN